MSARLVVLLLALCCCFNVFADRERGRGHHRDGDDDDGGAARVKFEQTEQFYKYEYRDAGCRYRYMHNYKSGKTKVRQKGDCTRVALPPRPGRGVEPPPRAIPPAPPHERIKCNRQVIGAVIGGAVGAAIGTALGKDDWLLTTAGGAIIGAVIGGVIGRHMDKSDHACTSQALEYAHLNQSVSWDNPATNSSYTVTPVELISGAGGTECRKFKLESLIQGKAEAEETLGTACRQADGSWRPQ